jgi:hypothetical protein
MTTIKKLQYKPKSPVILHRLPFVGGTSPRGYGISFWDVPATGGFSGGCDTGSALAHIYLKHLRDYGGSPSGTLQGIALDMLGRSEPNEPTVGQAIGFFSVIDAWLSALIQHAGANLDQLKESDLLDKANLGLTRETELLKTEKDCNDRYDSLESS